MRIASLFLAVVMLAAVFGHSRAGERRAEDVPYKVMSVETYAAFVKNWPDESQPFCAVIRSADDWDKVFSPAVTMGGQRPARPHVSLFEAGALLVVSRIAPAAEGATPVLSVVSLEKARNGCELVYRFAEPAPASYSVKHTLILSIPNDVAGPFRFVEQRVVASLE